MGTLARCSSLLLLLSISRIVVGEDRQVRQRAESQIRKITAMATDKTGRRMVSMSLADTFGIPRRELVEQRGKMSLDYGAFFVALELTAQGATISDLVARLSRGKTIWQIGEENHADWKRIASHARKQNSRIEDYIYKHFLNSKNEQADAQRDVADHYDLVLDAVRADFSVTPEEIVEAQTRYRFWRNEAWKAQGSGGRLSSQAELAARMDHADAQHNTSGGVSSPAAGGAPPP